MWPWEKTAVLSRVEFHRLSVVWMCWANGALPVSTSVRPSSVASAATLAKAGTNATPSATSSASPDSENGWVSSIRRTPVQRSSAMSMMLEESVTVAPG